MLAVTFQGVEHLVHAKVADPAVLAPSDAVVRVRLAGICGSDLHVVQGREPGLDAGTIMGHEFTGEIVALGAGVRTLQLGDRVACPFTTSCGTCAACRSGLSARCASGMLFGWVEKGVGLHGGQAELVRVPMADTTLWRLPESDNDELGLLLCDVIPTGYYSARRADLAPAGVHVVIGCGPVGLAAIAAARHLGSQRLFAIDRFPARLAIAVRFGATPIDLERDNPHEVIAAASDGLGADAVLEAVGNPSAARLAYELLRAGGTIASVGVHHADRLPFTPVEAYDKNLTYRSGRCPVRSLLPEIAAWIAAAAPDFTSMITHRLPLSQALDGYRVFAARSDGCIKVAVSPGG